MVINAAHDEGQHVEDISDPRFVRTTRRPLNPFSQEYRGYQTSAYAASALGQIFNQLWKEWSVSHLERKLGRCR